MSFVVNLEYQPYVPLFRRLSDGLRKAILEGRIKNGEALPSTRELSATLKLSRSTVLRALEDLENQGLIESVPGKGQFVTHQASDRLMGTCPPPRKTVRLSTYARRVLSLADKERSVHVPEINFGGPPLSLTPLSEWKRLLSYYCHRAFLLDDNDQSTPFSDIEPFGYQPLREAVAAYLHRARGLCCNVEQVAIFSTKQLRMELVLRLLLNAGDHIAFEEPAYPEARHLSLSHGAQILHVPVDDRGIIVERLMESRLPLKFVYVTPSHQDPTGAVLSLERRRQLLDWAAMSGAYIVEDDYDCEYRYGKKPLPSLMALDKNDCVIYLGSLWKVLFQLTGFGIVVFPQHLTPAAVQAKLHMERYLPLVEQLALTDLINKGFLERHIHRTRARLSRKRQALIYALTRHARSLFVICEETSGMHLIMRATDDRLKEADILGAARDVGFDLMSTAPYYTTTNSQCEFMISFCHIDEEQIEGTVSRFMSVVKEKLK